MITHIVLLRPKSEVAVDEIATVLDHVRGLQKDIPGIVETQAGENRSPNNQGYTYGFVMHFVDAEHLQAYAPPSSSYLNCNSTSPVPASTPATP
jgi:Stress responsive A/B Barrel Domain